MPSTSEVGHAKNVANLQKLIEQVTVYTLYNPPVESLMVPNLTALYSTASTVLREVEEKRNANKNAIALRQTAYENLKPICTRIVSFLDILGLQQATIDQARTLNRTIQGGQKKKTTSENPDNGQSSNNNNLNKGHDMPPILPLIAAVIGLVEYYKNNG